MEETAEQAPADSEYAALLKGTLDPSAFLDGLLRQDQSTPERWAAVANARTLAHPEIRTFFEGTEHAFEYHNLLSLSYFHRGQIEALNDNDIQAARLSFALALEEAKRADSDPGAFEGSVEWTEYVDGTLAYLEQDLPRLRAARERLAAMAEVSDRNLEILGNFVRRLESGEEPSYRAGYAT